MADAKPTGAGDAGRKPPAGGIEGFIDQVANFWKVSTRSSRLLLDGQYSLGDAAQDLNTLISSSASYGVRVADDLWGPEPPLAAYDGTWQAVMHVDNAVRQRPLTLRTSGLRAIGDSNVRIPPSKVTFHPPALEAGDTTFLVTVEMDPEHRRRTLIFEGEIEAEETGAPVTDPVRANNRDDGPVR